MTRPPVSFTLLVPLTQCLVDRKVADNYHSFIGNAQSKYSIMPRVKPKGLSNIAEFCPFYISLCNIHIAPLSPSNMNIALVHVSSPILHCQLL